MAMGCGTRLCTVGWTCPGVYSRGMRQRGQSARCAALTGLPERGGDLLINVPDGDLVSLPAHPIVSRVPLRRSWSLCILLCSFQRCYKLPMLLPWFV